MLICHKLVVSNEMAVLQACHVSDVHGTSAVSTMPALWEVVCSWAPHPVISMTSGLSNTSTMQRRITTNTVVRHSCRTHENCMQADQIIIIFYILFFYFLLYVFGIVFNCIIQHNSYCLHRQYFSIWVPIVNTSNNSSFTGGVFYPSPRKTAKNLQG